MRAEAPSDRMRDVRRLAGDRRCTTWPAPTRGFLIVHHLADERWQSVGKLIWVGALEVSMKMSESTIRNSSLFMSAGSGSNARS